MEYRFERPLDSPLLLRTVFENPVPTDPPLIVEELPNAGLRTYSVESLPFTAIQNGEGYAVTLIGLAPESQTELFRHRQPMRFYLPPDVFGTQ